jgi:hypothetical protein
VRPTITIVVLALAFCGVALNALGGQALGPGRHLVALVRYRFSPKLIEVPGTAERGGLVLDTAPSADVGDSESTRAVATVLR